MSYTTSSGVRKPNGAGLPMLSLSTCMPDCSMRAASSTTGPRTSYSTLSSLVDLLKWRMGVPSGSCDGDVVWGAGAWDDDVCGDGVRGASARPPGLSGTRFGCAGMSGRPRSWPSSHCSSTCSVSARNLSVSARGVVLPLTYWLMWLLPSLTPDAWAARTMSTCLR